MAYVPLSVRESPRFSRERIGWWVKGRREALAVRLAPWLGCRRSAYIEDAEREYWHAETWEEAAKALRDYYPLGCAVDTCSAAPERQSHFCARHGGNH